MINTNDFFNTMAAIGAIIFLLRKKEEQIGGGFVLKFFEINEYEKLLIENASDETMDIAIQNEEETKGVAVKYGHEEAVIPPGTKMNLILLPGQILTGKTYYGVATISILIQ